MPGPLLPLLANTLGRMVSANVTQSVAGAVGRAAAARGGQVAASAAPSEARSAFGYVAQYARQQGRRKAARAKRSFVRNAPGFSQAHRWRNVKRAFGQLEKARSAKQAALQLGDPLKVQQAEEQEEAAKQKLAKETKALLASFAGLKRGVIGVVIALHTLPHAIQAIGRAQVEFIRSRGGMYAGQTASSLVRYDVNERLNRISSARNTQASDSRLIEATIELNNSLKPLQETLHVLYTEGLVRLVYVSKAIVDGLNTFSPIVGALGAIANWLTGWKEKDKPKDPTIEVMLGMLEAAKKAAEQGRKDWNKNKIPPIPGGKP